VLAIVGVISMSTSYIAEGTNFYVLDEDTAIVRVLGVPRGAKILRKPKARFES